MSAAVRILTFVGLALYVFVFSIVVAGDSGWTGDEHVHFVGAVLMGLALVAGMGKLIVHPGDRAALVHGAAVLLALLLVQAVVGDPDNHGGQAGPYDITYLIVSIPFLVAVALALRLTPRGRGRSAVDPMLLVMGLVGLAVALPYAIDQALIQRNSWPPAADPHHNSHWATMSQVAVIPGFLLILSALPRVGSRAQALFAGMLAVVLGAVSAFYTEDSSSLGLAVGLAVASAGIAVILVATSRFRPASPPGNGASG